MCPKDGSAQETDTVEREKKAVNQIVSNCVVNVFPIVSVVPVPVHFTHFNCSQEDGYRLHWFRFDGPVTVKGKRGM